MQCNKCGARMADDSPECPLCGPTASAMAGQPTGLQTFPVWALILLHYVTLGIFSAIWLNLYHGKLPKTRPDDPSGGKGAGYLFIPFYGFYWIFFTHMRLCERINAERAKRGLKNDTLRPLAIAMSVVGVIPEVNILWYLFLYPIFGGLLQASINELAASWDTPTAPAETPSSHGSIRFEFTGSGLQYVGWGLLATLSMYLVIPTAWGFAAFWRWFVGSLRLTDGRQLSYRGDPARIWWAFSLASLAGLATFAEYAVKDPYERVGVGVLIAFAVLPGTIALWRYILIRIIPDVEIPGSDRLSFDGEYLPMLGWQALILVSMYSIVGWAWALAAATRWYCSKVRMSNERLEFLGKGHEVLWRGLVAYLACFGIVSIPWATKWYMNWFMENLAVVPNA